MTAVISSIRIGLVFIGDNICDGETPIEEGHIATNVVKFLIALASVFAWFGVFAAHRSAAKLTVFANSFSFRFALG